MIAAGGEYDEFVAGPGAEVTGGRVRGRGRGGQDGGPRGVGRGGELQAPLAQRIVVVAHCAAGVAGIGDHRDRDAAGREAAQEGVDLAIEDHVDPRRAAAGEVGGDVGGDESIVAIARGPDGAIEAHAVTGEEQHQVVAGGQGRVGEEGCERGPDVGGAGEGSPGPGRRGQAAEVLSGDAGAIDEEGAHGLDVVDAAGELLAGRSVEIAIDADQERVALPGGGRGSSGLAVGHQGRRVATNRAMAGFWRML